jgi:hypothetical protein
MHYTGMAAMRVRLWPIGEGHVDGINPSLLVVPITLLTSTALVVAALSALQAMTEEEFTDPVTPRVGRHATVAVDLGRIRAHRDRLTPIRPRTSWEDELSTGERWG